MHARRKATPVRMISHVRSTVSRALLRGVRVRRSLDPGGSAVALTFDDGPHPEYTPAILDELARLQVPATFFLVGESARSHPDLVHRILDEGHAVGSHSRSHPDPWRLDARALVREYRRGRTLVEEAAGRRIRLFRPPKGHIDARGALAMLGTGVRPWLWTIDPGDWEPDATADHIAAGCAELHAGDVVLLHDAIQGPLAPSALDRTATCAALAPIVDAARARNLTFTTLS